MQEMQVQALARDDTLEEEMATQSSVLAWKIPQTEEPGGLQSMGSQESDMTQRLNQQNYISDALFFKDIHKYEYRREKVTRIGYVHA